MGDLLLGIPVHGADLHVPGAVQPGGDTPARAAGHGGGRAGYQQRVATGGQAVTLPAFPDAGGREPLSGGDAATGDPGELHSYRGVPAFWLGAGDGGVPARGVGWQQRGLVELLRHDRTTSVFILSLSIFERHTYI